MRDLPTTDLLTTAFTNLRGASLSVGWQAIEEGLALGLSMVPGVPGTKRGLISWKPYQDRKVTDEEVAQWRTQTGCPNPNPLVITGRVSGLLVADVDGPGGWATLAAWDALPETVTVLTPRGAGHEHHWFKYRPELYPVHNFAGGYDKDLPHFDLRGDGGLAVYPGGRNAEGRAYRFKPGRSPQDIEIAPLPAWLYNYIAAHNERLAAAERERQERIAEAERLRSQGEARDYDYDTRLMRYAEAAKRAHLERIASAPQGERNDQLNRSAYCLAAFLNESIWTEAELEYALERAAIAAGLDRDLNCGISGVRRTIEGALRAGRRNRVVLPIPKSRYGRHKKIVVEVGL